MQYVTVRYSHMYYRGRFVFSEGVEIKPGLLCLIKSPRGIEMGKILSPPVDYDGEVVWLKNSKTHGEKSPEESDVLYISGEIIRIATETDIESMQSRFAQGTDEEMHFCNERIKAHDLPMKLAGVEYLFESEKIIFYFLADGRVDFRNLVKDLAKKYRTRIEMKQIGVRDEARLLAEYEHCGRRLCCKGFLNNLEPVTMKMAKAQKTTLDPSKISGRCGRLMCCLRYEDHVYQELRDNLPAKGSMICLKSCKAKVLSHDVLQQKLFVETEEGSLQHVTVNELVEEQEIKDDEAQKKTQSAGRSSKPPRRVKPQRDHNSAPNNNDGQNSNESP
ncbi:MAG: regulatory iron-sulfur-containing complex subunit RicT, partial [Planctomycetota bacterium]